MLSPALFKQQLQVAKIECGADHTLCLTKAGRVYLWGQYFLNSRKGEQIRHGMSIQPRLVESLVSHVIIDIACGTGHNLALTESMKMYSWGTGYQGELGLGPDNLGNYQDAQKVSFQGNVKRISAGVVHSCAITAEKRLLVWGNNR